MNRKYIPVEVVAAAAAAADTRSSRISAAAAEMMHVYVNYNNDEYIKKN